MVAACSITPSSSLQEHHSLDHSLLSADRRPSILRLGGQPGLGMGIFCVAGSEGTSPGGHGCGSRGDTELGLGPCRLCSPPLRGTSEVADLCCRMAAGSLLSMVADLGTCCCGPLLGVFVGTVRSQHRTICFLSAVESLFFVVFFFFSLSALWKVSTKACFLFAPPTVPERKQQISSPCLASGYNVNK